MCVKQSIGINVDAFAPLRVSFSPPYISNRIDKTKTIDFLYLQAILAIYYNSVKPFTFSNNVNTLINYYLFINMKQDNRLNQFQLSALFFYQELFVKDKLKD